MPLQHVCPLPQASPQTPQFCSLVSRLAQVPSQHSCALEHWTLQAPQEEVRSRSVQAPLQQPWPASQVTPQAPQLSSLELRVTQYPSQQVWPLVQALPQAPQLFSLVGRLTQAPLQQV